MRNLQLSEKTARDIDQQVTKVLRGLGNPTPPLRLADVRELLRLDLMYYSSPEDGFLAESISRVRIAARQVIRRPALLGEAIRKLKLKALWIPDRKRILVDATEPLLKHRWYEAHEIGHSIIEWHKDFLHGDRQRTLSPTCHHRIEGEANYAAGRLLFLQNAFHNELRDHSQIDLQVVQRLSKRFGNTITSTLWRTVEHLDVPAFGMVSTHPNHPPADFDWSRPCRYFIRSPLFAERFARFHEGDAMRSAQTYCSYKHKGPLGAADVVLVDNWGDEHVFAFESFNFTHDTLTLAVHRRSRAPSIAV